MVTIGGTDTYNVAGKLLKELQKRSEFEDYKFHVIVGSLNQNRESLEELSKKDTRILLHQNVKNMGEFMRQSEYAVSAGGTTLFELCASKIPIVCFSFAENQEEFVKEMGKRKIMLCAGDARKDNEIEKSIADKLCFFIKNKDIQSEYTNRMGQLVDGKGL